MQPVKGSILRHWVHVCLKYEEAMLHSTLIWHAVSTISAGLENPDAFSFTFDKETEDKKKLKKKHTDDECA